MDVILPVAGLGTRLRPQTWSKPKPLVAVAGKPLMQHVLDRVMPLEPEKLVFITGYLGDQIEAWARATYPNLDLHFVVQPEMLGQTDAIVRTRRICQDDALILFPDALFEATFSDLAGTSSDGVIFTKDVEDPSSLGVTLIENGRVTRLIEKPSEPISTQATVGIYYFRSMPDLYSAIDRQIRDNIQTRGEYFIADAIQIMIDSGQTFVTSNIEIWEDSGNAPALLQTNRYLLASDPPSPAQRPGAVILPPSFVDKTATLENAIIGPFASVGANTVIRDAIVRDSIVEEGATVESVIIERSVVGRQAEIAGRPSQLNVADASKVTL